MAPKQQQQLAWYQNNLGATWLRLMWAGARWCSAASGRRSGRSCWTTCSCSCPRTEGPGRPGPAAPGRAGAAGRRLAGPGRRAVGVGGGPCPPCGDTDVPAGQITPTTKTRDHEAHWRRFRLVNVTFWLLVVRQKLPADQTPPEATKTNQVTSCSLRWQQGALLPPAVSQRYHNSLTQTFILIKEI